jgi:putative DNA primase/helicase
MSATTVSYTSEQLLAAAKLYASKNLNRVETEHSLKSFKWPDELVTTLLDEVQRQESAANAPAPAVQEQPQAAAAEEPAEATPVVAPAPSEPVVEAVTETATEAESDDVTDDEIKKFAIEAYKKTANYKKTVDELLAEFAGISPEEARDFTGQALEEVIWDEQQHADQLQLEAAKARDKELEAKAEADHLFLENYGYKHRKRIKVSPEDEAKFAKLLREKGQQAASGPKTRTRRMSETRKKKLYWMWQNRIPYGTLSTIAGDPDEGKSLITLYLAAHVSRGEKLYGNTEDTEPGEVLLLSAEDDPEITLRPRLEAAGAYLNNIHLLESVMLTDGAGKADSERIAQLDTDIKAIERILDENPDIKLIIIDPISSFLGSANINREQEVRRVLQPLARRARNSNLAVVMVAHFNKNSETRSAMDRVGGAKAIVGMGRAAWTCIREPKREAKEGEPMPVEDPDRRLFLKLKGNLAPSKIGGLVYTIKTVLIEVEDKRGKPVLEEQPYILWVEETSSTAQEVVIDRQGFTKTNKIEPVKNWLKSYLESAGGLAPAEKITAAAVELGYTTSTLNRARQQLRLKQGWVGRESHWALPGATFPPMSN